MNRKNERMNIKKNIVPVTTVYCGSVNVSFGFSFLLVAVFVCWLSRKRSKCVKRNKLECAQYTKGVLVWYTDYRLRLCIAIEYVYGMGKFFV